LVLSTRESVAMRSRLARICITQLSAGSCTAPGGYAHGPTDAQFPVHDQRSVAEVVDWLRRAGFDPAWDIPPRGERLE
jgi:2-iminoacetate synthase